MKVICPGCRRAYKVDEARIPAAGLKMKCPKCSKSFMVVKKKKPAKTAVLYANSFSQSSKAAPRKPVPPGATQKPEKPQPEPAPKAQAKPAEKPAARPPKENIDSDVPAVLAGMMGGFGRPMGGMGRRRAGPPAQMQVSGATGGALGGMGYAARPADPNEPPSEDSNEP